MVPEAAAPGRRIRDLVDVVHEDVELALLLADLSEETLDLGVVAMIDFDGNAMAPCFVDHPDGLTDRQLAGGGAPGHVDRGTLLAEGNRRAATDTTARTGDDDDLAVELGAHAFTLAGTTSMSRLVSPRSMKLGWYAY